MSEVPRVALLGADLILSSRLRSALAARDVALVAARDERRLPDVSLVLVDLNSDAEARLEAIGRLRHRNAGAMIVGFCDHDAAGLRRRAMAAGASQVVANRHLADAALRLAALDGTPR
jgi:DNA-binding NarL/FixJ family response regulator